MNNPFPAVLSKYSGPIITHRMYDNKLGTTNIPYSHLGTQMGGHSLPESCTGLNFQLQCTSVWFIQACSLAPTHLTTFSSQTYLPPWTGHGLEIRLVQPPVEEVFRVLTYIKVAITQCTNTPLEVTVLALKHSPKHGSICNRMILKYKSI